MGVRRLEGNVAGNVQAIAGGNAEDDAEGNAAGNAQGIAEVNAQATLQGDAAGMLTWSIMGRILSACTPFICQRTQSR